MTERSESTLASTRKAKMGGSHAHAMLRQGIENENSSMNEELSQPAKSMLTPISLQKRTLLWRRRACPKTLSIRVISSASASRKRHSSKSSQGMQTQCSLMWAKQRACLPRSFQSCSKPRWLNRRQRVTTTMHGHRLCDMLNRSAGNITAPCS